MTKKPTRREILKTAATTSAASAIATTATATDTAPTVRVVETGIRYEVANEDDYHGLLLDSRPPYTVNRKQDEFILAEKAARSLTTDIQQTGGLFDERSIEAGESVTVGPANGRVGALPTELSARMRAKRALDLASDHKIPSVSLHWNGNSPSLSIESKGKIDLDPETNREIRLESETVKAQIVHRTETSVEVEGRPKDRQGPKRVYEPVEAEVTPIVEVVDHGELTLTRRKLP